MSIRERGIAVPLPTDAARQHIIRDQQQARTARAYDGMGPCSADIGPQF